MPDLDPAVREYYERGRERDRLFGGFPSGPLELARTQELISRHLPNRPLQIADVGGGPGAYASWLAELGHQVSLVDPVELHVEQAAEAGIDAAVGDARALPWADGTFDVVLLLGPLYHLLPTEDRLGALREAHRILKPDGLLFAAAISRFAALLDMLVRLDELHEEGVLDVVTHAVETGEFLGGSEGLFTNAYFHHDDELSAEIEAAGFEDCQVFNIEGPGFLVSDFADRWADPQRREAMLTAARLTEREPRLIGASSHLLALARAPGRAATPDRFGPSGAASMSASRPPAVLAGPRVRLRPPEPGDREARAMLGRHPEIVRGFGGADPERRELLPEALDAWWGRLTGAEHAWVIEYEGSFAGEIRLDDLDEQEGTASLSVGLFNPELLGQGLGSESVHLVLRYAFLEMRLERVSLVVLADNERAIRCYRTCGFVEEGRLRGSAVVEGERRDELVMAILRDEFLGRFGRDDRPAAAKGDWVEQRLAWLRTLPRKRMGAAVLIRDRAGRVLIAEPTYRSGWTVPGGMVEEGEGPWEACRREVLEELGHDIELGDLLCLHYQRHREGADESVMLVFDGGTYDDDWFQEIELRETELRSWKLVAPEHLDDYLSPPLARRFRGAIESLEGGPSYLGPEGEASP